MAIRTRYASYRFRAYPTQAQAATLLRWQGAQRFLWNEAHSERNQALEERSKVPSFADQCKRLTALRREHNWLKSVPTDFQQPLLQFLDTSWREFFNKINDKPHFKAKSKGHWAPLVTKQHKAFKVADRHVLLPKIGKIRWKMHRKITGVPKMLSITKDVDQWFVSVTRETAEETPQHPYQDKPIGLDLGIALAVADSNGNAISNPRFLEKGAQRLAMLQRRLARKRKGSENRRKAAISVAKQHRKITRQRRDWQHNLTNYYAKNHGVIVIEDLCLQNMTRSAKGTVEKPGKNVRSKSGLNRSLLDIGMYEIRRQLEYKAEWLGGKVVAVSPQYTSQICSKCGCCDRKNRKTQSEFRCVSCGYSINADLNAAVNILGRFSDLAVATTVSACGARLAGYEAGSLQACHGGS